MNVLVRLCWSAYLAYHVRGQARYAFRPWAEIEADQARRVRAMVSYAYRYVPYYRETMARLGLTPRDFRSADDLSRLPIVERAAVQRDPICFASTAQPLSHYLSLHSSGSSGAPIAVYWDAHAIFLNRAIAERFRTIVAAAVGQAGGYREAVIALRNHSLERVMRFCQERSVSPPAVGLQRRMVSLEAPVAERLALLNEFAPDVLHGYGSGLDDLFAYVGSTGVRLVRPRAVVFGSDALPSRTRRVIEQGFDIPVFGLYRAIEAFELGFECAEGRGYHLNVDLYPLRIVDGEGRTLPPGESGEVVISNLVNRGTVLLNYRLGDLGTLAREPCPCGRTLPLLASLDGRSEDWLEIGGRRVHPLVVHHLLANESGVRQYQIVQRSPTQFEVLIVPMEGCQQAEMSARIAAAFQAGLGRDVQAQVRFVPDLPRTAGGKRRTLIPWHPT